jgi:hypothetical protein
MGKYGTNLEGFGAFEGDVNADNGATLVATNSDGEKSQLFGPAALREIQANVANGDFEVLPNDATAAISESNPLPYWSFTDNSGGRIVATSAPSTLAVGQNILRFTLTDAVDTDEVYFTRYVPVPTSEARTYGNQPRVAVAAATASANYRITWSAQYVMADLETTTGTSASSSRTGTQMNTAVSGGTTGAEYQLNPNGTGSAPVDAAYLLLKLSVNATGSVASATLDIAEIRIDRSTIQYLVADQSMPDDFGPAAVYLYQGNLFLANGGVVGSEPRITLSAASGDIRINATPGSQTISLTSASRTASTVTIVTTRAHKFSTGYEVIVAGITGAAGTTMNGTYIVTVTDSTTFTYTAAGTAGSGTVTSATVKAGPGSGIIYLQPAATAAGRVQVDGDLVIDGANSLLAARASVTSATQSFTNATGAKVLLDLASSSPTTNTYDPKGWFSNANDRITVNQSGFYAITGTLGWAANATGRRVAELQVNGNGVASVSAPSHTTALAMIQNVNTIVWMNANDYVELFGRQDSGGALSTIVATGVYPVLSVGRIGA